MCSGLLCFVNCSDNPVCFLFVKPVFPLVAFISRLNELRSSACGKCCRMWRRLACARSTERFCLTGGESRAFLHDYVRRYFSRSSSSSVWSGLTELGCFVIPSYFDIWSCGAYIGRGVGGGFCVWHNFKVQVVFALKCKFALGWVHECCCCYLHMHLRNQKQQKKHSLFNPDSTVTPALLSVVFWNINSWTQWLGWVREQV